MNYQWYPGHMTKAKRMMQENIKLIDLIIELVDARAPPIRISIDIDELGKNKSRLILLNKSDLADDRQNRVWEEYFRGRGAFTACLDARKRNDIKQIFQIIQEACREKTERDRKRGILNRPVRAMVAGIPNVGKSTFINSFAGRTCAKTGNKPGVTKGKQWIRLNKQVELLDTPGILWPKFEDQQVGLKLAVIGSIREELLVEEELCLWLLEYLQKSYPGAVEKRYQTREDGKPSEVLERIAQVRGCVQKGGGPDFERAASMVTDDFRSGRLGRITLEIPVAEESGE